MMTTTAANAANAAGSRFAGVGPTTTTTTTTLVHDALANTCRLMFKKFLGESPKYRRVIEEELTKPERNLLLVDLDEVEAHSARLLEAIEAHFYRVYPALCQAVSELALESASRLGSAGSRATAHMYVQNKEFLLSFVGSPHTLRLRELSTHRLGQFVRIQAQVVRTHPVHPELVLATFVCSDCHSEVRNVRQQFKYTQPAVCSNAACTNRARFSLDVHRSTFVDFQRVRVQEVQAELPRGNVPRTMEIILRSECVENAQAGDKCFFDGCLIVVPDVSSISLPGARADSVRTANAANAAPKSDLGGSKVTSTAEIGEGVRGLKALGARDLNYRMAFFACRVAPVTVLEALNADDVEAQMRGGGDGGGGDDDDEEEPSRGGGGDQPANPHAAAPALMDQWTRAYRISKDRNLFSRLSACLFPTIYGCDEIKRGILLMLLGGVPKRTSEGINLRGDINICLVGDPSTAKSQFLRQLSDFAPRAIYTSGKASSAAGLTAAVVKDEDSFEFVIEAGALMLADNGICCIDEFDKMDPRDQVAIHEAMEQQTITLAKAGVKATLNARTSILAAANPIGGRYDRQRSLRQNVNMSAPIMSRFDLFFVLIDECNEVVDYAVAQQILQSHSRAEILSDKAGGADPPPPPPQQPPAQQQRRAYSFDDLRMYISVARMFSPRLSDEAQQYIIEEYKSLRQRDGASGVDRETGFRSHGPAGRSSGRVTVRQLESLIRLSEAVAKLHCVDVVRPKHVREAVALLSKSLLRVEHPDVVLRRCVGAGAAAAAAAAAAAEADSVTSGAAPPSQLDDGEDEDPAVASTAAAAADPDDDISISYEQYTRLGHLLLTKAASVDAIHRGELVGWYLRQREPELASREELFQARDTAERLIDRLINIDHMLIVLHTGEEAPAAAGDTATDLLMVHPSYIPDTDRAIII